MILSLKSSDLITSLKCCFLCFLWLHERTVVFPRVLTVKTVCFPRSVGKWVCVLVGGGGAGIACSQCWGGRGRGRKESFPLFQHASLKKQRTLSQPEGHSAWILGEVRSLERERDGSPRKGGGESDALLASGVTLIS